MTEDFTAQYEKTTTKKLLRKLYSKNL